MSRASRTDAKVSSSADANRADTAPGKKPMTSFVDSCVETIADSAVAAARHERGRPRFRRLLRLLKDKKNILVTTHRFPDPDAIASGWALTLLLISRLPHAKVTMSVRGQLGGGVNEPFARYSNVKLIPWDDDALENYDAIIMTDVQPASSTSPLPPTIQPFGVIDHHRTREKPKTPFTDIRVDVGATASIIFSYYMEVEEPINPDLAATLLYGIESDLAGAAGQPGELDNIALSSLTLLANTRTLYQMRYVDLPQSYYLCYHSGLTNAVYYQNAIISHLDLIDSPEKPAVIADFLLRFQPVDWALVTAVYENRLVISLRTSSSKLSAADMIRRLVRNDGEGGGHRTKAGGFLALDSTTPAEILRKENLLLRRYLRALKIKKSTAQFLIPRPTA